MFKVSEIITTPPAVFTTPLQRAVYEAFDRLGIPFGRVDTDPGLTMEDCRHIDEKIGVRIVKTVFLCNRQETAFWLYVTSDERPSRKVYPRLRAYPYPHLTVMIPRIMRPRFNWPLLRQVLLSHGLLF